MKHRNSGKIVLADFKRLYYDERLTNQKIAAFFDCHVSAIGNFRKRYDLPVREGRWANGHPFKGKTHTDETKNKISNKRKGKNTGIDNHMWKGGNYINYQGYMVVKVDEPHPYAYRGYVREHRLIVEEHLGRILESEEIVHHINHDKLDNRIENLCVLTRSEHAIEHFPKGSYFGIHSIKHK